MTKVEDDEQLLADMLRIAAEPPRQLSANLERRIFLAGKQLRAGSAATTAAQVLTLEPSTIGGSRVRRFAMLVSAAAAVILLAAGFFHSRRTETAMASAFLLRPVTLRSASAKAVARVESPNAGAFQVHFESDPERPTDQYRLWAQFAEDEPLRAVGRFKCSPASCVGQTFAGVWDTAKQPRAWALTSDERESGSFPPEESVVARAP